MGFTSVIARRLSDKYVQYVYVEHSWGCNSDDIGTVGRRLLTWYGSANMVEYLFGWKQLIDGLWSPHIEETILAAMQTERRRVPCWVDMSEREIVRARNFTYHGYFYDADQVWYYVLPDPLRVKMPLTLVMANLDDKSHAYPFLDRVKHRVLDEIFSERHTDRLERCGLDREELHRIHKKLAGEDFPLYQLRKKHRSVFDCFDDWVVVRPDESGKTIGEIVLRPKTEQHTETIFW